MSPRRGQRSNKKLASFQHSRLCSEAASGAALASWMGQPHCQVRSLLVHPCLPALTLPYPTRCFISLPAQAWLTVPPPSRWTTCCACRQSMSPAPSPAPVSLKAAVPLRLPACARACHSVRRSQRQSIVSTCRLLLLCIPAVAGNRRKEENMVKQTIGFNWGPAGVCGTLLAAGR